MPIVEAAEWLGQALHKAWGATFNASNVMGLSKDTLERCLVGCNREDTQEAGIGQGDPFPPHLFSFCAAIVLYLLRQLQGRLGLYLYIDDFLITFASDVTLSQMEQIFHEHFSALSGLQLNLGKSAYVTKVVLADLVLGYMAQSGLQHAKRVHYQGVQIGHVSTKEAFLGPMPTAFRKAQIATTVSLSVLEKISLLKIWILPTKLLAAGAYVADASSPISTRQCVQCPFLI